MGMRSGLIPRWYSSLGNKKLIIQELRKTIPDIEPSKRGQPPKHPIKDYLILIVLKECKKASLRDAETDWSEYVCGEPIDHSVIHYWERNLSPDLIEDAIRMTGTRLEELLGYDFSVIDATRFANWHQYETGFHLLNRICEGTVYPVNMVPDTLDPVPNTSDVLVPGHGYLMGDKWYDVNKVFGITYKRGYTPLISPQRTRGKGYWRRKGRKVYMLEWRSYRQRGRGESVFGSLTNMFGDRLNTRMKKTTYTRSCARVLAYQVRILIRVNDCLLVIFVNS